MQPLGTCVKNASRTAMLRCSQLGAEQRLLHIQNSYFSPRLPAIPQRLAFRGQFAWKDFSASVLEKLHRA